MVSEMTAFEICWIYEQDFSTIIEAGSAEEVRQKFVDGDFDAGAVDELDGRLVDGSIDVSVLESHAAVAGSR